MNADYVRTARAKGLTERTVVLRHAFRNAMIPDGHPGSARLRRRDRGGHHHRDRLRLEGDGHPLHQRCHPFEDAYQIMGVFIVTAIAVLVFNLIADISYAVLDPRIRLS